MRKLCLALLLLASCTDSTGISLYVPFALFASDELSATSTGLCGFTPITQAGGEYKGSGLLELDPLINPTAEYVLGLQVENYLDETVITDSNGDPLEGEQRNDFNMNYALIQYDDVGGNLAPVADVPVYISGTVRTGGEQAASAAIVDPAVGPVVVQSWIESFNSKLLISEQVLLKVQIFGTLNSGEKAQTGVFVFPLTLCFDCGGISPTAAPGAGGCAANATAVPVGHGPCCAPQDFIASCEACGDVGEPCCAASNSNGTRDPTGTATCGTPSDMGLTCSGMQSTTTTELCPYLNQDFEICAKPSSS